MKKKRAFLIIFFLTALSLNARHHRHGGGSFGFYMAGGIPFGNAVYFASGPQGSYPYYPTPVFDSYGYVGPYGYAAYAGPIVTWGW